MEKQLKKAVVEQLEYDIDRGNYGMFSTKRISYESFKLLARNRIQIYENKVFQDGVEVANIERRYSSRKTCGDYKELKPKVTWL